MLIKGSSPNPSILNVPFGNRAFSHLEGDSLSQNQNGERLSLPFVSASQRRKIIRREV